jgi:hypothetical protein
MKKKDNKENFLERIPVRNPAFRWTTDDKEIVTLEIDNKGFYNRIAQKLFKKPPITYIHLDKTGSFVWPLMDGEKDIIELGVLVKKRFGEEAEPLYERLAKFFQILESYKFITFR